MPGWTGCWRRSTWTATSPRTSTAARKKRLEEKLRSLVVPDAEVALGAGKILEDLPRLWKKADLTERRRILMTMLDAVYVDTVEDRRIVAIRPRPAFRPLMEIATMRGEARAQFS